MIASCEFRAGPRLLALTALTAVVLLAPAPAALAAQEPTTPVRPPAPPALAAPPEMTVGPQIQRIETASALSTDPLGSITSVRELPDGRVLVNDGVRRRLLLMDTTLTTVGVVLDSLSEIANTYGARAGALIPFRGDTTLFVDPASFAMVVLDPDAKVARIRSVWRAQDAMLLSSSFYGVPGVDGRGRIVYRMMAVPAPPTVAPPPGVPWIPQEPDSAFIVAVDIDTRRIDTLAAIRIPRQSMVARQTAQGGFSFEMVNNPLPVTDDWAVLADGRVAIVRAIDYRIEYLNPDGTSTESAKLPYEWRRLDDEAKRRMVDSVKTVVQRQAANNHVAATIRWVNMYNQRYPVGFTVPEGFNLPPGLPRDWILPPGLQFPENYIYACPPGVEPAMPAGMPVPMPGMPIVTGGPTGAPSCFPAPVMISGGTVPPVPVPRTPMVVQPSELPDYRPPISTSATRADMDGNLWIRTIQPRPVPGGPVYDIVSPDGELVNRIQLPQGYTLVGFGRDKVVYLSMRDQTGLKLARVRLR